MSSHMSGSDYEQITVADHEEVRALTLNRPEKLNAWTPRMHAELTHALKAGNDDPSIGAFVVTGAGRGFCAGADISEVFAARIDAADASADSVGRTAASDDAAADDWVSLLRRSKPIVAAINGASIGVGLTLVLSMDFLVAHSEAKLSCRFVKMGVTPELASSHLLVQRCGWGAASDLALSGRIVTGAEAGAIGLVDEVTDGDVLEAALERARSYAENPPTMLQLTKQLLTENGSDTDLRAVQRRELEALNLARASSDHREAVAAFLEKRPPVFR
ncbi:enoyl-CoA hydratase/isomerase family protein [Candidatus Poriferisodalis sp.]|uniref:enoyl-CoA hydratase/isomerase family protein n=1 Tax=Candidatus Poriferisodalis sp. TaxID=3101277 RepID=UPI003B015CA3